MYISPANVRSERKLRKRLEEIVKDEVELSEIVKDRYYDVLVRDKYIGTLQVEGKDLVLGLNGSYFDVTERPSNGYERMLVDIIRSKDPAGRLYVFPTNAKSWTLCCIHMGSYIKVVPAEGNQNSYIFPGKESLYIAVPKPGEESLELFKKTLQLAKEDKTSLHIAIATSMRFQQIAHILKGYWGSIHYEQRESKLYATLAPDLKSLLEQTERVDYAIGKKGRKVYVYISGQLCHED